MKFDHLTIRVVVPTVYRPDCPTVHSRLLPLCERLVAKGFSFTFYVLADFERELRPGICYVGYKSYWQLIRMICSCSSANTDLLFPSKPYSICGFLSYLVAKVRGIAYVLDVDDRTFPSKIIKWWRLPLYLQEWFVERMLILLKPATSVASRALAESWGQHSTLVPNSADTGIFNPESANTGYIQERHGLCSPVVIWPAVFFQETDRDYLIEVFYELHKTGSNIQLLIIGDGDYLPLVKQKVEKLRLNNVHFAGRVDYNCMIDYYASADAGVVPLRNNHYDACKGPIKLYEFMAMRLPVIATDIGEPAMVVKEADCGIVVPFDDAAGVARKISEFFSDSDALKISGVRGRRYLEEQYSFEKHAVPLELMLRDALQHSSVKDAA
jgi:phosphatidylinositol alpha-1,6-mannosyltransferase